MQKKGGGDDHWLDDDEEGGDDENDGYEDDEDAGRDVAMKMDGWDDEETTTATAKSTRNRPHTLFVRLAKTILFSGSRTRNRRTETGNQNRRRRRPQSISIPSVSPLRSTRRRARMSTKKLKIRSDWRSRARRR